MTDMEEDKRNGGVVNHFEKDSNCQVFNGPISGCVFAMPGSTVIQKTGEQEKCEEAKGELDRNRLASAIESCQPFFWGASAYAVVFCLLRDEYDIENNQSAFERMVEELPYAGKRDFVCGKGTLANAFKNNPVFTKSISRWRMLNAPSRAITLLEELQKRMEL